jgi:hypothetical protein
LCSHSHGPCTIGNVRAPGSICVIAGECVNRWRVRFPSLDGAYGWIARPVSYAEGPTCAALCSIIPRMPRSNPVSVVSDADLPAVEILLGPQAGPSLDAVLDGTGSRLRSNTVSQVRLVPSTSVTVQHRARMVSSTGRPQVVTFFAACGVEDARWCPRVRRGRLRDLFLAIPE